MVTPQIDMRALEANIEINNCFKIGYGLVDICIHVRLEVLHHELQDPEVRQDHRLPLQFRVQELTTRLDHASVGVPQLVLLHDADEPLRLLEVVRLIDDGAPLRADELGAAGLVRLGTGGRAGASRDTIFLHVYRPTCLDVVHLHVNLEERRARALMEAVVQLLQIL